MLINKEQFSIVEENLAKSGRLSEFESQSGAIKGRMMITRTTIPNGIDFKTIPGKKPQAFEASFDFYDAAVGVAIYTDTMEVATGIWITPQIKDAEPPAHEWIEFFIEKLLESINADGSYGVPIYSFVNDACDMTVIPSMS